MGAIEITPVREDNIKVRKKVIYRDMSGNWIAVSELSNREKQAFESYKIDFIDKGVKPLPTKKYS